MGRIYQVSGGNRKNQKMNKQTIITALLALVSLGASAQLESVKELSMKSEYFNPNRSLEIFVFPFSNDRH